MAQAQLHATKPSSEQLLGLVGGGLRRHLNPAITVKWMQQHTPNLPAVFDGLRKAGLPEE
jgi:hypothetical protein